MGISRRGVPRPSRTLNVDYHNHRATIGYWADRSGIAIHISNLPHTTTTSEPEAAVQEGVRREAKAILARLLAELENPGASGANVS
jgi:hypothetical protein